MFDIDALKEMKLLELQEIAQKIDVPKFRSLKKLDLVYQILDVQAATGLGGSAPGIRSTVETRAGAGSH